MSGGDSSSRICRLDCCELESIHLAHKITPYHVRCRICDVPAGQLCNREFDRDTRDATIEAMARARMAQGKPRDEAFASATRQYEKETLLCGIYHHGRILSVRDFDKKIVKAEKDPWTDALDESILRVASDHVPRILMQIVPLVENDYGTIAPTEDSAMRKLQRHIAKLCERGALLRVEVTKRLWAYILPNARIATDVDAMREVILDNYDTLWAIRGAGAGWGLW